MNVFLWLICGIYIYLNMPFMVKYIYSHAEKSNLPGHLNFSTKTAFKSMNTILGFMTRGYIIEAIPMKKCSVECVKESKKTLILSKTAHAGSYKSTFLYNLSAKHGCLFFRKAAGEGSFQPNFWASSS